MEIFDVNWLGVILSTAVSFVLGALWYSPVLFGKSWMKEAGLTEERIKENSPVFPIIVQAISTFVFTVLIFKLIDFGGYPLFALFFIAFCGMDKSKALFHMESYKLISINLSYRIVIMAVAVVFQLFF